MSSDGKSKSDNRYIMELALVIARPGHPCTLGVCVSGCGKPGHLVYHADESLGEKKIATVYSGRVQ